MRLRCVELEAAAQSAQAKFENSKHKAELQTTEGLRVTASLRQTVAELEAAREAAMAKHEAAMADLRGQLEELAAEHALQTAAYDERLAAANEEVDERVAGLKEQAAEYVKPFP